ncbi:heparanase-like, partial [Seriola lalandi dorsalis]|uniref:heparanase-like n=1 Tax=Seriola lalandi dorsalis TaxID=1841481 RepID=UPI000C6F4681
MTRVVLLLFWVLCDRTDGLHIRGDRDFNGTLSGAPDVVADVDLSAVIRRVDPRFLSVTIDASLASEEKFMYLLGSPEKSLTSNRTLFKAVTSLSSGVNEVPSPSAPSCDELELPSWLEERLTEEWTRHQPVLLKEDLQRKYRRVKFTEFTVDLLHAFANCSGLDLIFGLNALLRTADNSWNSSNARSLLQYCQSRRYRMNWELGNEPNSYEKKAGVRVDGVQLGLDFTRLREMMSESKLYQDAGLYGPDVGQPREHRVDILEGYYVNGRDTSLDDFLDPEVLDSLAVKTKEVME